MRGWLGVLVSCALVVTGCGSDGETEAVDVVAAVDGTAASTARIAISFEAPDQAPTTFEGEVDFAADRSHLRRTSAPIDVPDGFDDAFGALANPTDLLLDGSVMYLRGSDGVWVYASGAEQTGALSFNDVPRALEALSEQGQDVVEVGVEEIRGAAATRFRAEANGATTDLWIDEQSRLVRWITTIPGGGRATYDLFDHGIPVDIEPPDDALPFVALGVDPVDVDLREVATGAIGHVTWRLEHGVVDDVTECVRIVTDPAIDGEVVRLNPDGTGVQTDAVADEQIPPSCGVVGGAGDAAGRVVLLTVAGKDADVHLLAGVVDDGAAGTFTMGDGEVVPVESHDGVFVVAFEGDRWPTRLETPSSTCELQGDNTMSGMDDVC